jgi:tyrosyl-tRNA synthetase
MMNKETVKKRIEDPEKSISYTEFSYMLLQGYDYLRLYSEHDCKLQIAWSDQRWNIMTGLELIKRIDWRRSIWQLRVHSLPTAPAKNLENQNEMHSGLIQTKIVRSKSTNISSTHLTKISKDILNYLTLADFETIQYCTEKHAENPSDRLWQELFGHAVVHDRLLTRCSSSSTTHYQNLVSNSKSNRSNCSNDL